MFNSESFFLLVYTNLPRDCQKIIHEFLPIYVEERCFMCGLPIIMLDSRQRMHFEPYIVCTESVSMCSECFECFYL